MEQLKTKKWWIVTGLAMGAGVAAAGLLGAPLLLTLLVGAGGPLAGAFAHVLAGAASG